VILKKEVEQKVELYKLRSCDAVGL